MIIRYMFSAFVLTLALAFNTVPTFGQKKTDAKATTADTSKKTTATSSTVSDADIAAAQKDGKVWVNTASGVYHKGGRWYGKTKQGKFMTEDDAKKAGYHEDKTEAKKGQSK